MNSPKATTNLLCILIIFSLFILPSVLNAQQKAFPSAYGGGAYASGGRGGFVHHVTRLDDNYTNGNPTEGTFRWAVRQPRPATVVFDVSGIIELQSSLYIEGNDLTIAGQSAPEGGITITKNDHNINLMLSKASNIIIRYIRIRPLDINDDDAFEFYSARQQGGDTAIFDHLSISYGSDEGFSIRGQETKNITFQRGLIAESKTGSLFGDGDPNNGGAYSYNNSFLTSLFVNIPHRTPNVSSNGRADIINNVIYNWKGRLTRATSGVDLNHINNYHFLGNRTDVSYTYNGVTVYNMNTGDTGINHLDIYTSGNIIQNIFTDPNADNKYLWSRFDGGAQNTLLPSNYFTDNQYPLIGANLPIMTAEEAAINVPADCGANKYLNADGTYGIYRDANDTDYVNMVQNDAPENYSVPNSGHSYFSGQRFANFAASVSTTPINTRPDNFYAFNQHIPEVWFQSNVPAGQDHNDIAPSGYTWLEEYLNGVDSPNDAIDVQNIEVTPNTADLQIAETLQLNVTFTPQNATNQNGTWTSSNEDIATVDVNGLVTGVAPGSVTITFTSADGGFTDTSEITVFPEALQASAGIDQQICEGGSATLTATGGNTYLWSTGDTTANITVQPTQTTTYTVTVFDSTGNNSDSDDVIVNVNPLPIANAGEDVVLCSGEDTILTASGGDSYLWSTGAITSSITVNPTNTTTYTVEVAQNGCVDTDDVVVTVGPLPTVDAGADVTINIGESVNLNATGAIEYIWSSGETDSNILVSPISTTIYSVTGTSENGCANVDSVTVNVVDSSISTNAGPDVAICEGNSTTLTASGGTFYEWNTGETTASIDVSPNSTTSYTVTVLDSSGANPGTDSVTVTVNPLPTVNAGADIATCRGTSVTLTATGGESYLWSNGSTSASITVNPNNTTTYTVEADQNGCTASDSVIVTVNPLPSVNAGADVTIDVGQSVSLTATGAGSYSWNTGASGATINVSPTTTTTYTVTGTNSNGCISTDTVRVNVQSGTNITANAGSDASICSGSGTTLTASGGSTYLWSTGETTASITVSPGSTTTYTVTAYDDSGFNSDTDSVTVTVNPLPTANAGADIATCRGTSVTLTATGGESYLWSNGSTSASITVNPNNTTTYTVEADQNGCTASDSVIVTVNPLPSVNAGADVTIDVGQSVSLTATGAGSYSWNTGASGATINVSPTTTTIYTVTGTNSNGCSTTDSVKVIVQTGTNITANAGSDASICSGSSTTLTASGGSTYLWSTGATTASITVSPSLTTTYTVTAYDDSGFNSDTDSVTVTVNPLPTANAGADIATCRGTSVTLTATGGESYLWSNGSTSASITVNPNNTTTYTVEADQNGCTASDSVIVTVNPLPSVNAGADVTIDVGQSVSLTATGAGSYSWNTGASGATINVSPTTTTIYTVTGTNSNGCSTTDSVKVIVQTGNNITANAGSDTSICSGSSTTLTASGGSTYLWSTGATTASITVSPGSTTTYTVTAYDTAGINSDSDEVKVTVNPNPVVSISNGEEVTILQGEYVTLSATGANRYEWNNGAILANIAVNPSNTTTYSVSGYIGDCSDSKAVRVNVVPEVIAFAGNDQTICRSEEVTLTASGGDEYLWSTGETTANILVAPEDDTEYSVTVYNELDYDTANVMVYVNNCPSEIIEDSDNFEFLAYPNPTAGKLNIKISGLIAVSNIALFDLSGKLLFQESITNDTQQNYVKQLDLSPYSDGLYLLKLVDDQHSVTKKIIIHR